MLGLHFDQDPQLPWVRDHLNFGRTVGAKGPSSSLLRLRDFDVGRFRKGDPGEAALVDFLWEICVEWYPQKAKHQGEALTRQALALAFEQAKKQGIRNGYGLGIFGGMTFMLGLGFDRDLQFPWAQAALSSTAGGEEKAKQLYAGAMAYLQFGLAGE